MIDKIKSTVVRFPHEAKILNEHCVKNYISFLDTQFERINKIPIKIVTNDAEIKL